MKMTLLRIFILAFLMLVVCRVGNATEPPDIDCDGNRIEIENCMGKILANADRELNATYQSLISLVRNHGEEWVQDLRAAQRKWLEFKKLNCEFYGNYLKGGTGVGIQFLSCEIRMTRERAKELQEKRQELIGRGYEETK